MDNPSQWAERSSFKSTTRFNQWCASMIKSARSIAHKLHLPKVCMLCQLNYNGPHAICHTCLSLLPQLPMTCSRCAIPLPNAHPHLCGQCIQQPPVTEDIVIAYPFVEPLRTLIHCFKYQRGLYLTSALSHLIYQHLPVDAKPEVLIPVPIHRRRLQERGFNQAALLAKQLSQWLNIPDDIKCCKKIIHTPSQMSLPAAARKTNLSDTFSIKPVSYQHIALIDDVYTTGSTIQSLALSFKDAGVKRIDAWCIARTI